MAAGTVWDVLCTSGREKLEKKTKKTKTAIVTPSKVYSMSCACLRGGTPNPDVWTDTNVRQTPFFLEVSECVALCKQTKNGDLVLNIFNAFTS